MTRLALGVPGLLTFTFALPGCTHPDAVEFILCPFEVRANMEREADPGRRRELLFPLPYEVAVVERHGEIVASTEVLRANHSIGAPHATSITLEKPTHVSDFLIVRPSERPLGVAIRRPDQAFRVQWLSAAELREADRVGVLFLKRLDELPILNPR